MVSFGAGGFFASAPFASLFADQPDRIEFRTTSGLRRYRSHGGAMTAAVQEVAGLPDMKVSIRQVFGIDSDMEVPAYSKADEHVPDVDPDYRFDRPTTLAILAGFSKNRRVMVTGYH